MKGKNILNNNIVFGGSGFIGQHLLNAIRSFAVNCDLEINDATSQVCNVHQPIVIIPENQIDVIYNLAAVHKTPGHEYHEYFETNIIGAESDTNGVFNIGRGETSTINDLAKTITRIMGKNLRSEYKPPRPGDVKHSLADISRARAIGYEPQYSLDKGLKETIKRLTSAS